MATDTSTTDPPEDQDQILDLTDLVRPRRSVRTTAGTFPMSGVELLAPIDRAQVQTALSEAQRLAGEVMRAGFGTPEAETLADAMAKSEDVVLAFALPGSEREERDRLTPPERAAIVAAFYGAADDAAFGLAQNLRKLATDAAENMAKDAATTGAKRSRGSKRSTAATRKAG